MKKLFIVLILFGITNVYAESGKYTTSTVCDYAKSAIDTNNKTVIALNFNCIGTIIKSDSILTYLKLKQIIALTYLIITITFTQNAIKVSLKQILC